MTNIRAIYPKGLLILLFSLSVLACTAQSLQQKLNGTWVTKNEATVAFYPAGSLVCGKQLTAKREKDKPGIGKIIANECKQISDHEFEGILYIPSRDKTIKAKWELAPDGKTLTVKVKWMFMSYSEEWKKIK